MLPSKFYHAMWPNVLADEEIAGEPLDIAQRKREAWCRKWETEHQKNKKKGKVWTMDIELEIRGRDKLDYHCLSSNIFLNYK